MAQLLSIRSIAAEATPPRTTTQQAVFTQCSDGPSPPTRIDSAAQLFQADTLNKEDSSFQNPVFQDDEQSIEQCLPHSPSLQHTILEIDCSKRSSTPSDSGIHLPYDSEVIHRQRSLDSGVDEINEQVINGAPVGLPPYPGKPPIKDGVKTAADDSKKSPGSDETETLLSVCVQVFIPFIIAGIGTCGAGLVLDYVEKWTVFVEVKELFILVPTLLGLKGNLEMTLASRVSTQANLGLLNTGSEQWRMCWGNMALVQCQATMLSLIASLIASAISGADKGFDIEKALLLCASALFTASVASFVLGAITLAVVLISHRFKVNPDNVATPIAASLGDVTTMGILAAIASFLYSKQGSLLYSSICIGIFVVLVPGWLALSYINSHVKRVLFYGWAPVIIAVAITSVGGYILEFSVGKFEGFAIFQPVINGVAGNLVAVQASRISTYFHRCCEPGSRPPGGENICVSPFISFCAKTPHSRTARVLLTLVVPGHLLFGYGITLIKGGETALTLSFLPIYLTAALVQVMSLLYIAQCLINFLWRKKMDPDNWAIPLLTALGDLSGMIALTAAFSIHRSLANS